MKCLVNVICAAIILLSAVFTAAIINRAAYGPFEIHVQFVRLPTLFDYKQEIK